MSSALVYGEPRERIVAKVREELANARKGAGSPACMVAQNRAIALLLGIVISDGERIAELEARAS